MKEILKIEKERSIFLPSTYKKFYEVCYNKMPENLVGTDLFRLEVIHEGALELLADDGIDSFLTPDDFVFMMHQGYQFWYFKADGNPDPIVNYYYEGKLLPENVGVFSSVIQSYLQS